jgi:anhydro-N-acetylmuramic acid kinase
MSAIWAIGLMTGTSLDGNIDAALIKSDGVTVEKFLDYQLSPYPLDTRVLISEAIEVARKWNFFGPKPDIFKTAEKSITLAQSEAVNLLIKKSNINRSDIGVIGFHGQTVLHRPPEPGNFGKTLQLGDGSLMSQLLGIPVVYDFRAADIKSGCHGAPLCASYHKALLERLSSKGNVAILNLGGIGNITWWGPSEGLVAFDTGPANAPINDFVGWLNKGEMDWNGEFALNGQVDEKILKSLLCHSYFSKSYPKSLDRFDFSSDTVKGLSLEDGCATLTAFCASTVGKALDMLPIRPTEIIVCGGGRHNSVMLKEISIRGNVKAIPAEDRGFRGDAIEAECFGYLAVRCLKKLPISFPNTTGVPVSMSGGKICHV